MLSKADLLSLHPAATRRAILSGLTEGQLKELLHEWGFWGRPEQHEPAGDWSVWLVLAGRGFGKTRTGAEWIRQQVMIGARSIALVAETHKDLEEVMVYGESGIASVFPPHQQPRITKKPIHVEFHTGAVAYGYNATEPDQLRGPNFDVAWSDELAKWRYAQETWDMLQFALRKGSSRQVITTTPRPIPLLKAVMADPETFITRGSTEDNAVNLSERFRRRIYDKYSGTRLGRQELNAEILDDMPDALWNREMLDATRIRWLSDDPKEIISALKLTRIVVAIDPAAKDSSEKGRRAREAAEATGSDKGAAHGIVVASMGEDGRGYVLEDATMRGSPEATARRAIGLYDKWDADKLVGEVNNGGDWIRSVLQAEWKGRRGVLPYRAVTASRGKWVRAEPVAMLYEKKLVSHVGTFADLENEMVLYGQNGMPDGMSPDHMDAMVWALTELFPHIVRPLREHAMPVIIRSRLAEAPMPFAGGEEW